MGYDNPCLILKPRDISGFSTNAEQTLLLSNVKIRLLKPYLLTIFVQALQHFAGLILPSFPHLQI